jgi:hypothetical protein
VKNEGPDSTSPYTINWAAFRTSPTSYTIATGNGGVFGDGQQKPVRDDPVYIPPGTPGGTQYCERVGWDPIDDNHNRNGRGAIVCATVQYDFDLTPIITTSVNGSPPVAGSVAEVGDNVQFVYQINNGGGTSASVACTIYSNNINGYHPAPNPAESTAGWGTVGGTGCPRIFPAGSTQLPVTDNVTVPASSINKSICRVFTVNPTSFGGGSESVESCIQIGAKPYMRVYGGDVSVGNGQPTACTIANSGVIGWNKETPSYAGAGAQYAVMAIGQINDFASTLGNAAGATAPSSLAFANTTISGANIFGGGYGSLPCIPDYYSRRTQVTTVPLLSTDLSTLTGEQNYTATGPILIGGNINMGQKTVLFVNGDVLITSNITYPASWPASSSPPLFQIIAKGNIFVSQNVTRIDGIYIAQPTTAASTGTGKIITCANTGLPVNPVSTSDTAIYTKCQNALTINGAFVAKDVWFLRTRGSLSQSSAAETNASTNIAEIFNYSPAFWIPQPEGIPSDGGEYDSVTSLPPVL